MQVRVLICGDRDWKDEKIMEMVIHQLLTQYGDELAIIHGGCWGADEIAGRLATRYQLICVRVPAKWDKHGNSAGPIRNRYMLEKCKPHLVIAFHPNLSQSKGTGHMVKIAREAGLPVIHVKDSNDVGVIHEQFPTSLCSPNPQ